ncbi:DNA-binding transcriptional regulator [Massilia sp. TS11]|uniref:helix-turn-helix domain-containing protein n=1 Tax=Massilia sp. TS11 TaxID=2908003 RepID=UPI001EDA159B|nr:helix-turn-helix transcriptional regulator [Massilia sp. TS11]MCG2584147.1 helix-turn-helix domain-containing protein [Massilia sp. TS11]
MNGEQIRALRKSRCETQADFWRRFGVTQSCGSRIEQGGVLAPSLAILIALYVADAVSDADLDAAQRRSMEGDSSGRH